MTIASTPATSSGATIQGSGLIPGLNTQQIISALLKPYEQPIADLKSQQSQLNSQASDYQAINTDVQALLTAAEALAAPPGAVTPTGQSSSWAMQATSSDATVATATASGGTPPGSVSFTVNQLAQNDILLSSGTVSSQATEVAAPDSGFLLSQASSLGFSELAAGSGLALGSHSISVTQASQGASTTGTTALASSTSITSSNDTIGVTVNGTAETYTIAAGTYTPSELAKAVASASGGTLDATVNPSGDLVLSTAAQGSAASLQVTGGTALGSLGLATMSSAVYGVNALVKVDGTVNTLGDSTTGPITAGATFTLTSGTGGTITATVGSSGSISVGSTTATNVSTGNGSLSELVSNINAANAGVTASAIDTGNGYLLDLSSNSAGTNANLTVNTGAFSGSTLGTLTVSQAGRNAQIEIGGSANDVVTSQANTVSGLLPGLTINLLETSTSPVTISVSPDAAKVSSAVSSLVSAANKVLGDINSEDSYNSQTKTAGPLLGSAILGGLKNQILNAFAAVGGTSNLANAESVGITLNPNGTLDFNSGTFEKALAANPTGVEALFSQGGTLNPSSSTYAGTVGFVSASNSTQTGDYGVTVDSSATQASDTGAVLSSGAVSVAETLGVSMNGKSVSYTTTAGESLSAIAEALNSQFGAAGIPISAQVVDSGQQLQLTSSGYGSAQSFTVTSSDTAAGTTGLAGSSGSSTFSGTNVSGTIDGVAATGVGQYLTVPAGSGAASGLSLLVTAPGIASATNVGTFGYSPGIAQVLSTISSQASNATTGSITTEVKNLQTDSTDLNSQIQFYTQIASQENTMLQQEYSNLQVQLESLNNQSSELSASLQGIASMG